MSRASRTLFFSMRLVLHFFVLIILQALHLQPVYANERLQNIATTAELQAWLQTINNQTSDGTDQVALLAPTTFGHIRIAGWRTGAKIIFKSADPNRPASLTRLDVSDSSGIVLKGLKLKYSAPDGAPEHDTPFRFRNVSGLELRNMLIEGDLVRNVAGSDELYPHGFGIQIDGSNNILIENSEIRNFTRGVVIYRSDHITLRGNNVHSMRSDGLNFAQISHLHIEGNLIRDFKRAELSSDHADMIQIWTTGTDYPSHNIVIRNNVLNAGTGLYTQSIFMRNELVDRGIADDRMYYENIAIEGNVIINSHLHGITVGEVRGLTIASNTLVRSRATRTHGDPDNHSLWTPQINVSTSARDVRIERNAAWFASPFKQPIDWKVQGNLNISDRDTALPGHYDKVFRNPASRDPSDLKNFTYLPDGPLGTGAAGAPMLLP